MADIRELRTAIGFHKQTALQTALVAADTWSLRQTNRQPGQPDFTSVDDKDDLGKGTPFATQNFPVSLSASYPWEAFLTSENAAMLGVFGIGLDTKTGVGTGGFKYTCKPSVLLTASPDMPATTIVSAIRQGSSDVFDFSLIGMCCNDFSINLNSGPGRDNATMKSNWVGCGKFANPSTITIPAIATEHSLNAGGATTITINGTNYISNKRFLSAEFAYNNNIRLNQGYYPGSGTQSGYNLRGRMWRGDPSASFKYSALFEDGSNELADFLAQTEGTATISIRGALISSGVYHTLTITLHRIVNSFQPGAITDAEGLVAVNVDTKVFEHPTDGVLTYEVTCTKDEIGTAA